MKLYRSNLISLIFAISLTFSCNKFDKPSKDNLVIAIEKAPMSLDPRYALDTFSERICRLIYDGLLEIDDNFNYVPDLAQSYTMPDEKTYVFKLKRNVHFHDGSKLTSEDVRYTYETIMDPEYGSVFRNAFINVDKIETPDEYTVVIRLKKPYAPFRTAVRMGIIPKRIGEKLGKEFSKQPVGTGVFKLKKNLGRDGVILERFPDYKPERAKLKTVTFKPVLDDTVRTLGLLKGSIDLVLNAIPAALLTKVRENEETAVKTGDGVQYQYMGFNLQDPVLKNLLVRRAIAHAIDRSSIIKYKLGGLAKPSTGLLAPINWAYYGDVHKYDYDPEKAKKLLDRAGYGLKQKDKKSYRLSLTYKTSTNPEALEIAGVIAANLRSVGIEVTLRSLEFGVFFDDIKSGNFQIYTLSWTGITEPDHYHYIFNSESFPPNGANRGRYKNKEMDRLTSLARVTVDQEKQKKIYAKIQQLAAEELPYVSLWHKDNVVAYRKSVKGFKLKANGDYYYLRDTHKE